MYQTIYNLKDNHQNIRVWRLAYSQGVSHTWPPCPLLHCPHVRRATRVVDYKAIVSIRTSTRLDLLVAANTETVAVCQGVIFSPTNDSL